MVIAVLFKLQVEKSSECELCEVSLDMEIVRQMGKLSETLHDCMTVGIVDGFPSNATICC